MTQQRLGYFWGEDAFGLDRAVAAMAAALTTPEMPIQVWRTSGEDDDGPDAGAGAGDDVPRGRTARSAAGRRRERLIDEIEQRIGTSPLFGGGTLVVVRQPGALVREAAIRKRLVELVPNVPDGNGLAFVELRSSSARGAAADPLRDAVAAAGGAVREYPALTAERMEGWLATRAGELDVRLGPGAARLLAERVGAHVREADVDRRRRTELANAELEKLALYRPSGTVTREDVAELVPDAVPPSTWSFLDAVGGRRIRPAADLAERLLRDGTPIPLMLSQLHRRIRELLLIREHLDAGTRPPDLAREMRMAPFRVQKLVEQARTWTLAELEGALLGLLDVDLESKGVGADGRTRPLSDERAALAVGGWLAARVARGAGAEDGLGASGAG